ncbi:cupredoxin domain-containing protein [Haloplanus aerogenes]|nr:plastocyanin/azurin family copper-binding protein [Haloplanus aerogenes]
MDRLTRRRTVQATIGLAVAGFAGCTGAPASDDAATDAPTAEHGEAESSHGDDGGHETEEGHDETTSSDGHHHGGDEVGSPTETAEVNMITNDAGHHFDPHVVRIAVGGTVTFVNESGSHTATAYHPGNDQPQLVPDGSDAWGSGLLTSQGATFQHTFDTEGIYHYYCAPHESLGMIGSVVVGDPDPHEAMAMREPPAAKSEAVHEKLRELNTTIETALGDDHD